MADNSFKINKSVNFNPQAGAPANPIDGDFFYDSVAQSFAHYHNGSWANFNSVGTVGTALWLTGAQFTPAVVRNSVVKVTGGVSTAHLAGISASFSAKQITIYNAGSALIVVEPEDANETTANNRIQTPTGGSMNLIAGEVAVFTYDVVVNRWLLVSISSNAGAQVIATTTNPGIVTLHQASLFPLDGIVLSDGDLNTANGVVGLDANRAATIAAPTAAVSALTITANANAAALTLNQGSSFTAPVFTTKVASTAGDPHYRWLDNASNPQGYIAANGDINFLDAARTLSWPNTTYIVSGATGTITMFLGAATESAQFFADTNRTYLQLANDGGPTVTLRCEAFSSAGQLRVSGTNPLEFHTNSISRWQIAGSGELQAGGAGYAIQNVTNPVNAQDAATKSYADILYVPTNYLHNGRFDFWQRYGSNTVSVTTSRLFIADRWSLYVGASATDVSRSTSAPDHARYSAKIQRPSGNSSTNNRYFWQEVDRDNVRLLRGKLVQVTFWAKKGADFTGDSSALSISVATGTGSETSTFLPSGYGPNSYVISSSVTLTTSWQKFTKYATANVGASVTTMAVIFDSDFVGTASTDDSFYVTGVMLLDANVLAGPTGPAPAESFIYAGGSWANDLSECQRYFEKSYNLDTELGANSSSGLHICSVAASGGVFPSVKFQTRKRVAPTAVTFYTAGGGGGSPWNAIAPGGGTSTPTMIDGALADTGFSLSVAGYTDSDIDKYIYGHWAVSTEI
jgi:hypothetical protein